MLFGKIIKNNVFYTFEQLKRRRCRHLSVTKVTVTTHIKCAKV